MKVLRLKKGDPLKFTDGEGKLYSGKLSSGNLALIEETLETQTPPKTRIHVIFSPVRWERTRFAVEKAVELGASTLIFETMHRTTRSENESKLRKAALVARDAMKQSGSFYLPKVKRSDEFGFPEDSMKLLMDVRGGMTVRELAAIPDDVVVAIGPEGGFTEGERKTFMMSDFKVLRLGQRTLRTETAVVAVLTAINILRGNF